MKILKQSTPYNLMVLMIDATTHVYGKTGLTLTITLSKNAGAFLPITPAVTEKGSGWYNIALTATDTNTLGDLALHIEATGADPLDVVGQVFEATFDDMTGIWIYGPVTQGTLAGLLLMLRLKLGDTNMLAYRYTDDWLMMSLAGAIMLLSRYWGNKYLLTSTYDVIRNTAFANFESAEPPVIQFKDEWIIILAASVIIKSGSLENSAWDLGSWRDAELSFSNIASGEKRDASLQRDIEELNGYLKKPIKRPMLTLRTEFVE